MSPDATRQLFLDGIRAAQSGDRARGRELLLQVVEADPHLEPAWLWLSQLVDDPADQLVALENALTLNPSNAEARKRLEQLKRTQGLAVTPPPAPAPSAPALPAAAFAVDQQADDPLQCVYCGQRAAPDQQTCPHCQQNLMTSGHWLNAKMYFNTLLVLSGSFVQLLMWQTFISLMVAQDWMPTYVLNFLQRPSIQNTLGSLLYFLDWAPALARSLFFVNFVRTLLFGSALMMLYSELGGALKLTVAAAALELLWIGFAYWQGYTDIVGAGISAFFAVPLLLIGLVGLMEQYQSRVRVIAQLDKDVHAPVELHKRALKYQMQGQLALAVLHWRKAISLNPREPLYYKSLGTAQLQLRRYRQASVSLEQGADLAPNDAEFKRLLAEARAKAKA